MKQLLLAATLLGGASVPALAADLASGADIRAAIAGNTVQGGMSDGTAYTEFYAADGTVRGAGYTGDWSVRDDRMCFDYGEGATCWSVGLEADAVTWIRDGVTEGTGTLVEGNPNGF